MFCAYVGGILDICKKMVYFEIGFHNTIQADLTHAIPSAERFVIT